MNKFNALELQGQKELTFDIYDQAGNLIIKKGEPISPSLIMKLNYKEIYKKGDRTIYQSEEDSHIDSKISATATKSLLNNTKKILQSIFDGETPEISICEATRDTIIEEVKENIDKIDCIGQLRVFDEYTYSHAINVASMCAALAFALKLQEAEIEEITFGALMHDIGKMKVPKEVLNKPGKLTDEEFNIMKNHTVFGHKILIEEMGISDKIANIALHHQEKYGGFGYPHGLKGEGIPKYSQIASIADVYDALVSKRVYKQPIASHDAIRIMIKDGSKAFNPSLLYKFIFLANYKDSTNLIIE